MFSFNRFFTKTKVEISCSSDDQPGHDDSNRGGTKEIQQVMKKPGNNRIPGKNVVPSPIGDRKRYKLVKKVRYNNLEYFVFYRSFFSTNFPEQ